MGGSASDSTDSATHRAHCASVVTSCFAPRNICCVAVQVGREPDVDEQPGHGSEDKGSDGNDGEASDSEEVSVKHSKLSATMQ